MLKDQQTNLVPEQLNFTGSENLITHVEIQGNNLKQALPDTVARVDKRC